jgi:hypothetical protein
MHCMKRRREVTLDEFRSFVASEPFDRLLEELAVATGAVRWSKTVALQIAANVALMAERGSDEPFDAILEVWWRSANELSTLAESSTARELLAEMEARQAPSVDFQRSVRFFTEWDEC